jgi:glyoxylase-like metal-dependent hydrolase (beta-lactamase superfamily II)
VSPRAPARGAGSFDKLCGGIPAETDPIVEGERIGELRDPWQASLHFGHAEGHVCLYWQEADLLISGDQLLPAISSNSASIQGRHRRSAGDFLARSETCACRRRYRAAGTRCAIRGAATRAAQVRRSPA